MNPSLGSHIQDQQDTAVVLEGVIEAISLLRAEGRGEGAVDSLIVVAGELVARLTQNLDGTKLPEADGGRGAKPRAPISSVEAFLEACTRATGDPKDRVPFKDLWEAYRAWVMEGGAEVLPFRSFARAMASLVANWRSPVNGFGITRCKVSRVYYVGLKLTYHGRSPAPLSEPTSDLRADERPYRADV